MDSRVSVQDVEGLSAIGKSYHGSEIFEKEFYQMSMRPTILSNISQKRMANDLQKDIEKQEQEIALL